MVSDIDIRIITYIVFSNIIFIILFKILIDVIKNYKNQLNSLNTSFDTLIHKVDLLELSLNKNKLSFHKDNTSFHKDNTSLNRQSTKNDLDELSCDKDDNTSTLYLLYRNYI